MAMVKCFGSMELSIKAIGIKEFSTVKAKYMFLVLDIKKECSNKIFWLK